MRVRRIAWKPIFLYQWREWWLVGGGVSDVMVEVVCGGKVLCNAGCPPVPVGVF